MNKTLEKINQTLMDEVGFYVELPNQYKDELLVCIEKMLTRATIEGYNNGWERGPHGCTDEWSV